MEISQLPVHFLIIGPMSAPTNVYDAYSSDSPKRQSIHPTETHPEVVNDPLSPANSSSTPQNISIPTSIPGISVPLPFPLAWKPDRPPAGEFLVL